MTDESGATRSFDSEEAAEEFVSGREVEHRRGAFFIKAKSGRREVVAAEPTVVVAEDRVRRSGRKGRRSSSDEVPES